MIRKLMAVIMGAAAAWPTGWNAVAAESAGLYCVLDLSAGASATSYSVTSLDAVPSGGWSDEYKTDKIVLRRIDGTNGVYYAGVFEITEAQWNSRIVRAKTDNRGCERDLRTFDSVALPTEGVD